jgi:hypothetical protein
MLHVNWTRPTERLGEENGHEKSGHEKNGHEKTDMRKTDKRPYLI